MIIGKKVVLLSLSDGSCIRDVQGLSEGCLQKKTEK